MQQCWIHALPNELISNILGYAALNSGLISCRQRFEFPRVAQLVCRRWRLVTCSTPALWAFLDITKERSKNIRQHLKRSGVLPLEVSLKAVEFLEDGFEEEVEELGLSTQEYVNRIWKLNIEGREPWETYRCVKSLPSGLANLCELVVESGHLDHYTRYHLALSTPQLRSLSVYFYSLDWRHLPIATKLEELEVTEINRIEVPLKEFMAGLQGYPNLRKLVLRSQILIECGYIQLEPMALEQLEILRLIEFSTEDLRQILSVLCSPRLKELQLVGRHQLSSEDSASVPLLNLPVLTRLSLEVDSEFALEVAKQLPSINHLVFNRMDDLQSGMNRAFDALASHWRALPNSPPLKTLSTKGIRPSTLLSLLEGNRSRGVPSLRKVSMHYADIFLSRNNERFMAHVEAQNELSGLVELEIGARTEVNSWGDEQKWAKLFKIRIPKSIGC